MSTFLKSLDIPWPSMFGVVMARVNVVNLNLVQLPKAAWCAADPQLYAVSSLTAPTALPA